MDNYCVLCDRPCASCEKAGNCLTFKDGWTRVNKLGIEQYIQCKARHCKACSEFNKCEECKDGYILEDDKCIRDESEKLKAEEKEEMSYEDYCQAYNKNYTQEEKKKRQAIYDARVEAMQNMNMPYSESINNLTDWTDGEIRKMTNFKYTGNKFGDGKSSKIRS